MISKPQPEPRQSTAFLKKWNPAGPWVLTAIQLDRKGIKTKTFYPEDEGALLDWLNQYSGEYNIYFHVNSVTHDLIKKAERTDIKSVDWLHVDIDPKEGNDLTAERESILEALLDRRPKGVPEPTVIIFSGGGYQAFWKLKEPIPVDGDIGLAEEAKRYNQQLETLFGADNCHNIDRIMRLPGTLNIPDARKIKKGRTVELATLLVFNGNEYDIDEFTPAPTEKKAVTARTGSVMIPDEVNRLSPDLQELDTYGVSERVKTIIVQGIHPEHPKEGDNSRSAWLFDVVCSLVRAGVPDDMIFSVITDHHFKISESVLEQKANAESYAIRQIERAKEWSIDPILLEMNEKFAVIGDIGGKCRVIEEVYDESLERMHLVRQSFEDFRNRHMHIKIQCGETTDGKPKFMPLGKWWLEHEYRRQYDRLVFAPGQELTPDLLNLWRGFAVSPRQGDCSLMKRHVYEVIAEGNQEYYDYIMQWAARAVQYPGELAEVLLVMIGGRGTGKGIFAHTLRKIFGRHGLSISSPAHLVGNFNAHLQDLCFLFADEISWSGSKKAEGVLKALITEEQIAIERKGVDVVAAKNCLHIIMASNENWVVPAGVDERRFAVFHVSDKYKQDTSYFEALIHERDNGGLEAMLYDLLHMDIQGWHPRHNIPQTLALKEQKLETLGPIQRSWFECLASGELECHRRYGDTYHVSTKDFADYVNSIAQYKNTSPHAVGAFFGESRNSGKCMGFPKEVNRGRKKGYLVPELPLARALWDNVMFPYRWNDAQAWTVTVEEDDHHHF